MSADHTGPARHDDPRYGAFDDAPASAGQPTAAYLPELLLAAHTAKFALVAVVENVHDFLDHPDARTALSRFCTLAMTMSGTRAVALMEAVYPATGYRSEAVRALECARHGKGVLMSRTAEVLPIFVDDLPHEPPKVSG